MTEKKPGEPNDRDKNAAGMIYGTGTAIPNGERIYKSACNVIAAYREEIESRARREGAQEALERAAKVAEILGEERHKAHEAESEEARAKGYANQDGRFQWLRGACQMGADVAEAIRALADQPEAEVKEKLYACNKCGYCGPLEIHGSPFGGDCNYRAFLIKSPAKADALPLGHRFKAHRCGCCCTECPETEAAHGRKPE